MPDIIHEGIKISKTWLLSLGSSNLSKRRLSKNAVIFVECTSTALVLHGRVKKTLSGSEKAFGYKKLFNIFDIKKFDTIWELWCAGRISVCWVYNVLCRYVLFRMLLKIPEIISKSFIWAYAFVKRSRNKRCPLPSFWKGS